MKFFSSYRLVASLATLLAAVTSAQEINDSRFQEISTPVPQGLTAVHLPPECGIAPAQITRAMYTLVPAGTDVASTRIYAHPPNLVSATAVGNTLRLQWNHTSAAWSNEGGIEIVIPSTQLREVSAAADAHVQILEGFTSIQRLEVSSDANLWATIAANTAANETTTTVVESISLSSDAEAWIQMTGGVSINNVRVSSNGILQLEAYMIHKLKASSDAKITLKGNVDFADLSSNAEAVMEGDIHRAELSSDAELTVYGELAGDNTGSSTELSSNAKLIVSGPIAGSIVAKSNAKVRGPNCNTVQTSSNAECTVDDGLDGTVEISVDVQPLTMSGTVSCSWGWPTSFSSSVPTWGWVVFGLAIFFVIFGMVWFCCGYRRRRDMRQNTASKYPNNDVEMAASAAAMPSGPPTVYTPQSNQPIIQSQHTSTQSEGVQEAIAYPLGDNASHATGPEAIAYKIDTRNVQYY